ncbi:hypothetical protein Ngar_c27940 [Candidatus Nitrososphaera gargensis Ga9.2]|uniref:Uncharacterized protein n=1 Tax=Nitrososphaera gargensis (strain Ga9.2) TaxID=1237085 RepID=K0IIJ0_NITGG|nr:hypothetical protein Ngar_c27940 [Candidatus Nitrososphaera gargensis Ga9.2]
MVANCQVLIMDNDEIRYKLLLPLYNRFYDEGYFSHNIVTDGIINESGLTLDSRVLKHILISLKGIIM